MSNYAIMRFAKYKVGSVANIERHQNRRDRLRYRKHPERENENYTWKKHPETMTQTVRKALKEQERTTGRKVRKDANVLCELVLTFSSEEGIPLVEWVNANIFWVEDTFGQGKMIRFDLNRDEATTHLHCFVLMTDENGKFNASRFFNKKSQLIALQDSYAEAMIPFGLERGQSKEQTGAMHQTLNEWRKSECERLEKEVREMTEGIFVAEQENNTDYDLDSEIFDDLT